MQKIKNVNFLKCRRVTIERDKITFEKSLLNGTEKIVYEMTGHFLSMMTDMVIKENGSKFCEVLHLFYKIQMGFNPYLLKRKLEIKLLHLISKRTNLAHVNHHSRSKKCLMTWRVKMKA